MLVRVGERLFIESGNIISVEPDEIGAVIGFSANTGIEKFRSDWIPERIVDEIERAERHRHIERK